MDRNIFALRVARGLRAAEHSNDRSISAIASLISQIEVRADTGIAPQASHRALQALGQALTSQIEANSKLVIAHERLARAAQDLGIPQTAIGPLESKPDPHQAATSEESAAA